MKLNHSQQQQEEEDPNLKLLRWIVADFQPWSVVQSPSFEEFCGCLGHLPPSTCDLLRLAEEQRGHIEVEIHSRLRQCDTFAVQANIFTNGGKEYTSVMVSFLTPSMEHQKVCLGVISGPFFEMPLCRQFLNHALRFEQMTHLSVTKSNLCMFKNSVCTLRVIDTLVQEAISESGVVEDTLAEVLADNNPTNLSFVSRMYTSLNLSPAEDDEDEYIMSALLQPFLEAYHTLLEDACPSKGLEITVMRRIRQVVAAYDVPMGNNNTDGLKDFQGALLCKLGKKFPIILGDSPADMWTMPLDPRLIHMGGLVEAERETVRKTLEEKVVSLRDGKSSSIVAAHAAASPVSDASSSSLRMGGICWGDDDAGYNKGRTTATPAMDSNSADDSTSYAKSNVERYFSHVMASPPVKDPLSWWKMHQKAFPELAVLARKWLAVSTTVPTLDGRSSFPDTTHLELTVYLHDNEPLLSKEY
jgi:hypothetical protein